MSQTFEDQVLTLVTVNSEVFWHRLPVYVVWVYGLVLAWRRRNRHPKVSLVAFVALAGFLLESLGGTFLGTILAAKILDWGWRRDSAASLLSWMDFAESILVAALWGLGRNEEAIQITQRVLVVYRQEATAIAKVLQRPSGQ